VALGAVEDTLAAIDDGDAHEAALADAQAAGVNRRHGHAGVAGVSVCAPDVPFVGPDEFEQEAFADVGRTVIRHRTGVAFHAEQVGAERPQPGANGQGFVDHPGLGVIRLQRLQSRKEIAEQRRQLPGCPELHGRFLGVQPQADGGDFPLGDVPVPGNGLRRLRADFGHGPLGPLQKFPRVGGHLVAEEQVVIELHGGRCPIRGRWQFRESAQQLGKAE